jgi:hypothetical protein
MLLLSPFSPLDLSEMPCKSCPCQSRWSGANGRYERALRQQPHYEALGHPAVQAVGWGLVALGQTLVVTSIYALGITGQLSYIYKCEDELMIRHLPW